MVEGGTRQHRATGPAAVWPELAVAAGALLELYVGWHFWTGQPRGSLLWLAAAATGGPALAGGLSRLTPAYSRLPFWLYLCLCLFLPFYGALGSIAIAVYLRRTPRGDLAATFAEYIEVETRAAGEASAPPGSGSVDQMIRHELSVQPYMDIMRGTDRALKKSLIAKIQNEWTPNAVALLKQGLQDPEYEIRSYASTALAAIENRMGEGIQRLRRQYEQSPDAVAPAVKLAQSYLDYASSGLMDASSARHYVNVAGSVLRETPEPPADSVELWLQLMAARGRIAREQGNTATEEAVYRAILALHPGHQETVGQLCALLFRQRRFRELRDAATRFLHRTPEDHPALASARLWARESGKENAA